MRKPTFVFQSGAVIRDSPERYCTLRVYAEKCGVTVQAVYSRYSVVLVYCNDLWPRVWVDTMLSAKPAPRDNLRGKRIHKATAKKKPKLYIRSCGAYKRKDTFDYLAGKTRDSSGRFTSL